MAKPRNANSDSILYGDHARSGAVSVSPLWPDWFPDEIAYSQLFKHADYYWQQPGGFVGTSGWAVRAESLAEALSHPEARVDAVTDAAPRPAEILGAIRKLDPLALYTQELTRVHAALMFQPSDGSLPALADAHIYRHQDAHGFYPRLRVQVSGADLGMANLDQVAFIEQTLQGRGEFKVLMTEEKAANGFLLKLDDGNLLGYVRFDFIEY